MEVLEAGSKLRNKAAELTKKTATTDVETQKKREGVKAVLQICAKLCEAPTSSSSS